MWTKEAIINRLIFLLNTNSCSHFFNHLSELSNEQMRNRIDTASGATKFINITKDEVEKLVISSFNEDIDYILDWLNDNSDGEIWEIEVVCDKIVGMGYIKEKWHNWSKGPVDCSSILVILKKTNSGNNFYIASIYPTTNENDKKNFLQKK